MKFGAATGLLRLLTSAATLAWSAGTGLLALVVLAGCDRAPRVAGDRTVYAVKGTVERTYPGEARIRVAHERIPGYMEAMTMDFDAKDTNALMGVEAGD